MNRTNKKRDLEQDFKMIRNQAISVRINSKLYEVFQERMNRVSSTSVVKSLGDFIEQAMLRYVLLTPDINDFNLDKDFLNRMDFDCMETFDYCPDSHLCPTLAEQRRGVYFNHIFTNRLLLREFKERMNYILWSLDFDPEYREYSEKMKNPFYRLEMAKKEISNKLFC